VLIALEIPGSCRLDQQLDRLTCHRHDLPRSRNPATGAHNPPLATAHDFLSMS
jgi:hypothetical protein